MRYKKSVPLYARLTALSLLSILAACGGKSEQEEACDQAAAGYFPILNGIKCVFGATDNDTLGKASPETSDLAGDSPSYGYQTGEYEPNTSLNNSNPLVINDLAIAIRGNIGLDGDTADNFILTPNQTGDYRFSLCTATCEQVIGNDTLNLMVLDQSQTTIASTSSWTMGEKSLSIRLNAGVAYYAAVSSFGTSDNYRLAIYRIDDGA